MAATCTTAESLSKNALYHNNGDGTFTDVTESAGVPGTGYGLGCVWGDYDNDGFPDLYVTQFGRNVLYHNNGNGTFTDVTDKAGVAGVASGTMFHGGATFFDYDRDGRLDLYVGGYVTLDKDSPRYCDFVDIRTNCPPSVYKGSPAILYHNNGDGTFTDVTSAAGIYQPDGKNLSVAAVDYDDDGWPDIFVANDGVNAYLYHNEHNGTFTEVGLLAGNGSDRARQDHGRHVHVARRLRQRRPPRPLHFGFPEVFRPHLAQRRQRQVSKKSAIRWASPSPLTTS